MTCLPITWILLLSVPHICYMRLSDRPTAFLCQRQRIRLQHYDTHMNLASIYNLAPTLLLQYSVSASRLLCKLWCWWHDPSWILKCLNILAGIRKEMRPLSTVPPYFLAIVATRCHIFILVFDKNCSRHTSKKKYAQNWLPHTTVRHFPTINDIYSYMDRKLML